jgi:crotonobetainyl-CoA:carnitine CoA-transferase CaiB-like acyl-CoA transferase
MRNVTLSARDELIDKARLVARSQQRTLNDAFREWLAQFAAQDVPTGTIGTMAAPNPREAHLKKMLSLMEANRDWLTWTTPEQDVREYDEAMEKLKHVDLGGPYTRDEMNER